MKKIYFPCLEIILVIALIGCKPNNIEPMATTSQETESTSLDSVKNLANPSRDCNVYLEMLTNLRKSSESKSYDSIVFEVLEDAVGTCAAHEIAEGRMPDCPVIEAIFDAFSAAKKQNIEEVFTKLSAYAPSGDPKAMARALSRYHPDDIVRGHDLLIGSSTLEDIRILKENKISAEGFAEALSNLGKLNAAGIRGAKLEDLQKPSSYISRLKKTDNVGFYAEAQKAVEYLNDADYDLISMQVLDEGIERDLILRNKHTGGYLLDSVKNRPNELIDNLKIEMEELKKIRDANKVLVIDSELSVPITEVRLSITEKRMKTLQRDRIHDTNVESFFTLKESLQFDVKTFRGVEE